MSFVCEFRMPVLVSPTVLREGEIQIFISGPTVPLPGFSMTGYLYQYNDSQVIINDSLEIDSFLTIVSFSGSIYVSISLGAAFDVGLKRDTKEGRSSFVFVELAYFTDLATTPEPQQVLASLNSRLYRLSPVAALNVRGIGVFDLSYQVIQSMS